MLANKERMEEIARVIFLDGKPSSNIKKLHHYLRVLFKIILGCIHHVPSSNLADYINITQRYMMYYLSTRINMNLPSILFKYLREMVKQTINGSPKLRKWIPLGRLISDILFESKFVQALMGVGMTKEVKFEIGKKFNGRNMKNIFLITTVAYPSEILYMTSFSTRRIQVDDYPIFSMEEYPIEVLESYIAN